MRLNFSGEKWIVTLRVTIFQMTIGEEDMQQPVQRLQVLEQQNQQLHHELNFAQQQNQAQQAAAPPAAAIGSMGPTGIDARALGKPATFSGQASEWPQWAFLTKAYVGALSARMRTLMESATISRAPISPAALPPSDESLKQQLYYMLTLMCKDGALKMIQTIQEGNGLEVWRKFTDRYEPKQGQRFVGMPMLLLSWDFGDENMIIEKIDEFIRAKDKYEEQTGDGVKDSIARATLLKGLKNQRRLDHLTMNTERLETCNEMTDEIKAIIRARQTTVIPMEIAALNWGKEGKKRQRRR